MNARTLNLDSLSAQQQSPAVLAAFDALAPGEALILEARGALRGALKELIARRWRAFDWAPLAGAGSAQRALLCKRATPLAISINAVLSEDHQRLHALLATAGAAAGMGDADQARAAFGGFDAGLRHHIIMEEDGFFPDFEERTGMHGEGPTEVMRQEHVEIRGLLDRIAAALADGDCSNAASAIATLAELMEQHDQ